ncbi:MAG: methyltransferase [Pyrobaculum sp.]
MLCKVEISLRHVCLAVEEVLALAEVGECRVLEGGGRHYVAKCDGGCDVFNRAALIKAVNNRKTKRERRNILRSTKTLDFLTARLMANLARVKPGQVVWEPFVGTGAIAYEVEKLGGRVVGGDLDVEALRLAIKNTGGDVVQADATAPPLRIKFDAVVTDPPYGRLTKSTTELRALLNRFVEAATQHVKRGGYLVFASPIYVDLPYLKSCAMYLHGGLYRVVYILRVD